MHKITSYFKLFRQAATSVSIVTTTTFTTYIAKVQAVNFSLPIEPAAKATGVDVARDRFGLDGTGIKIGVISDSFNTSAISLNSANEIDNYATNIRDGYLPPDIQILRDIPDSNATDEGRAALQLIHAVAPKASLAFYAMPSTAAANAEPEDLQAFANGVRNLAAAGADVIVDDIGFSKEPEPPNGSLNLAIQEVFNQGVAYFSSAGNDFPYLSTFGHANNPAAATVGAVYYGNQPVSLFDNVTKQGELQSYSSAGNPNSPFLKPDFVAPDGLDVSFNIGQSLPLNPDTGLFSFFGTSVSAPYTAAVAGLLLEAVPDASPTQIYSVLRDTAQPLDEPGFNYRSGYGLIQADKALVALRAKPKSVPESSQVSVFLALGCLGTGLLLKRDRQ